MAFSRGKKIVIGVYVLVAALYFVTTQLRAEAGFWDDGFWIAANSVFYILFFGLTIGLGVSFLLHQWRSRQ